MDNFNIKRKVLSSLFWKLMERGGTQGIQFVVQIILARLLLPEDYGIIAMVIIFTSIANVFVQSGLNTALIQKKDADEADFSSVFYLSLVLTCLIYIVLFFAAIAHSRARWPLVKRVTLGVSKYWASSASSCLCFVPILVSQ